MSSYNAKANEKQQASPKAVQRRAQFKFSKERFQYRGIHKAEPKMNDDDD
jgi:hypothetical protein